MYKLFYFDPSPAEMRYLPIKGVWPSVSFFFVFLRVHFPKERLSISYLSHFNFIKIPFNGVHDSEATGYSLSDIKYRAPRVSLGAKREGPGN